MDRKLFVDTYYREGVVIVENILDNQTINSLKKEITRAIDKESSYHGTKDFQDYGMILSCMSYRGELLRIFENEKLFAPFEYILGNDAIVYSNTSSSMPPKQDNYSSRIHIDCPVDFPNDYPLRMLSLIVLDDFTNENGATFYLPRSHKMNKAPSKEEFYQKAKIFEAKAGSIIYWNPKIWHAGGTNLTNNWRHALTIVMTRSFMRQRLDIPKLLGDIHLSDSAKRRLGYFSYPPASYDEYYGRK
jgi:ectoine hydroxylase-related dioxygenase (phytanoyl-CoA dioxygenase family)